MVAPGNGTPVCRRTEQDTRCTMGPAEWAHRAANCTDIFFLSLSRSLSSFFFLVQVNEGNLTLNTSLQWEIHLSVPIETKDTQHTQYSRKRTRGEITIAMSQSWVITNEVWMKMNREVWGLFFYSLCMINPRPAPSIAISTWIASVHHT